MITASQAYEQMTNTISEATNISFDELSDKKKPQVDILSKLFKQSEPVDIFDGIHGVIVMYDAGRGGGRLRSDQLKTIMKVKDFRWLEGTDDYITIGL